MSLDWLVFQVKLDLEVIQGHKDLQDLKENLAKKDYQLL